VGKAAAARGVRIVVDLPDNAGDTTGDPEVLVTALAYVIDLAALRSRDQEVHVFATLQDGAPVVEVVDQAGPVPEGMIKTIFEPFVERDILPREPQGRRKMRLGVGLRIARAMLEAHGGSIVAEETAGGQGLVMRCKLAGPTASSSTP
jgi:two-component system, OmpR family, sensor kinase